MKEIKTIHILANCYWGDGMSGGDRRLIELLRRWTDNNKYELILYTVKKHAIILANEGINNCRIVITDNKCTEKTGIITAYMKRMISCKKQLKDLVKTGDYIYSTTDILPDVYPAYEIRKSKQVKWVTISYHIYEKFYKRPGNIIRNWISCSQQKMAINYGKKRADVYMTTSLLVYDYFKEKGFDMTKVVMTDNAVDTELVETSNLDENGYDAVFLARLNNSKGVMELPEIWKRVTKEYPDVRLGIIGKGSEEMLQNMNRKIEECGCKGKIDILGFLESEKTYSIIKKSKIFLFTSHEEGWGMALAEAQVCGIPVVAYDLPIYSKLFVGMTLCPLLDVDKMAEGVCKYLGDEELRTKDGLAGREHILKNYPLDAVAEKELSIILGKNQE